MNLKTKILYFIFEVIVLLIALTELIDEEESNIVMLMFARRIFSELKVEQ